MAVWSGGDRHAEANAIRLLAIATLALASAGALVLWNQPPEITREKYDRIHKGMTRAEVEALLGSPGDYSTSPLVTMSSLSLDPYDYKGIPPEPGLVWTADIGVVEIWFDEDNRVTTSMFDQAQRVKQSPLENLVWRAKRQWRKWFP
jgi:hypothetical protein